AIAATRAARVRRPGVWLGVVMIVSAAAALAAASRVDRLPLTIAAMAGQANANFTSVFGLQVALAIVMQLPMTIALGAAFPFAIATASPDRDREAHVAAIIYGSNTVGAVAGALAG